MAEAIKTSRDEAHDLYMQIFDEFATDIDPSKQFIVDYLNYEWTTRKVDQQIVVSEVNGGADGTFWQCWNTYDSISRDEAEERFNSIWSTVHPMRPIKVDAPSTTVPSGACRCGCGAQPRKGKGYLPGHDARHAGQVARAILSLPAGNGNGTFTKDLLATLPTTALRAKAMAQVERGNAKPVKASIADRHAAVTAPEGVVHGYITRNRVRVPAQTFQVDGATRMNINDAADGSGDWLDADGYDGKTQAYWLKRFHPTVQRVTATKGSPKRARRRPGGDGPEALKDLLTF